MHVHAYLSSNLYSHLNDVSLYFAAGTEIIVNFINSYSNHVTYDIDEFMTYYNELQQ